MIKFIFLFGLLQFITLAWIVINIFMLIGIYPRGEHFIPHPMNETYTIRVISDDKDIALYLKDKKFILEPLDSDDKCY